MGRIRRVKKYEFIYILDPSVDDARVAESFERYQKIVRDHGGEVTRPENWGRRRFAYDINKKSEGSYLFMKMRCNTKAIDELHRTLRFDESVLRSLIVLDDDAEARNAAAARRLGDGPRDSHGDMGDDRGMHHEQAV
jgi:small subunit ribosomal protein S6